MKRTLRTVIMACFNVIVFCTAFLICACAESNEYSMYPMDALNITQKMYAGYSHSQRKAIDIKGSSPNFYAPFTGTIKKIYGPLNAVWFESLAPVQYADGSIDYMTILIMHDNDISDLYVGKTITQGTKFYDEGVKSPDNNVTGPHVHMEVGKGRFEGSGWYTLPNGKTQINNAINPYDAFYLSPSTLVIQSGDYPWIVLQEPENRPNTISYENSTYRITKACELKSAPSADSDKVGYANLNDQIIIKALVKNKYNNGNMWLQTTDDKFIFSGLKLNVSTGKYEVDPNQNQHVAFVQDNATVNISGTNFPTGTLSYPISNFPLKAEIVSPTNTIAYVSGGVYYAGTNNVAFGLYKEQTVNSQRFSLANSSIDNALTFRSITEEGNYEFRLKVYYYTDRMQRTVTKEYSSSFTAGTSTPTVSVTGVDATPYFTQYGEAVYIGGEVDAAATVYPSNATDKMVSWSSSNTAVATVRATSESQARITGVSKGTAVITCRTNDGGYTSSFTVNVLKDVTGIQLAYSALTLYVNDEYTIPSTVLPTDASNQTVHWSSSDTSVIRIGNDDGRIDALKPGTATVTAMTERGGYTATCVITVVQPVWSITLSSRSQSMKVGDTATISASVSPSTATNKSVTWSTSNSAVATVSGGRITAVGIGTATITCAANDGSGVSASCAVTVYDSDAHVHVPTLERPYLAMSDFTGMSASVYCRTCGEVLLPPKEIDRNRILSLPGALQTIESEAFAGADMQQVVVPEGTKRIEARAFANCRDLLVVYMPDSVKSIADDAFAGCDLEYLCIMVDSRGTYAASYAGRMGINLFDPTSIIDVSFDANGGTCGSGYWEINVGERIGELPVPTRANHRFDGWYTALVGGIQITPDSVFDESIVLYAHWTQNTCEIRFDANGGYCAESNRTVGCGDSIGALPTPTRTYYSFKGWYTAASGGTRVYDNTTFVSAATLYAQWAQNTCVITFNENGGTCYVASKTIGCGDTIGVLPTPTRTYYSFDGWFTAESGGSQVLTTTTFASSATLYAHWTLKGYGSWSGWSTTAYSASSTRQVETKMESVQTGTKTTYSYDRYLYYYPVKGYYMSSYASNWATSQGYSGSWQYLTLDYALTSAGTTDGVAKYSGYYRDGNQYWWHQSVSTQPIYENVTYYRYRDLIE